MSNDLYGLSLVDKYDSVEWIDISSDPDWAADLEENVNINKSIDAKDTYKRFLKK
jgi:hypothetical protein